MAEKLTTGDVLMDARIKVKIIAEELEKLNIQGVYGTSGLSEWAREIYQTLANIRSVQFFRTPD